MNEGFDGMETESRHEAPIELAYPPAHDRWTCATFAVLPWSFALVVIVLTVQNAMVHGISLGTFLAVMFVVGIGVFMGACVMQDVWTRTQFSIQPQGILATSKFVLGKPTQLTWPWADVLDLEIKFHGGFRGGQKYELILQLVSGASHALFVGNSADKALALKERIEEIRGASRNAAFR